MRLLARQKTPEIKILIDNTAVDKWGWEIWEEHSES
jgi:hypothetical protein